MRTRTAPRYSRGVAGALIIFAIAAFFTAFMLYGALSSKTSKLDKGTSNQKSFAKLDEAVLRFVMTHKRLPCPALGTQRTGLADPDAATNTCGTPNGIVPWGTLGLSEADALDSWGRYISYRIFDGGTGFTSSTGFDPTNCLDEAILTSYSTGTCANTHENTISDFVAGRGISVSDLGNVKTGIAYVLISHGESGSGAYYPGATAPNTPPSSSSKEYLNAGSAGTYWIVTPSTPDVAANSASHFDDYVTYMDASILAKNSKLPRAWPLDVIFDATSLPTINNGSGPVKVTYTAKGAVSVTASSSGGATRGVCRVSSTTPNGVSACTGGSGTDMLTPTNSEALTFDFKVKRTQLLISLANFETGSGVPPHDEQVQLTFYNGATALSPSVTLQPGKKLDLTNACTMSGAPADLWQFKIAMASGVEFTKVKVVALNKVGTGSDSDVAISEIAACHSSSIAPCKLSTDSYGYCS